MEIYFSCKRSVIRVISFLYFGSVTILFMVLSYKTLLNWSCFFCQFISISQTHKLEGEIIFPHTTSEVDSDVFALYFKEAANWHANLVTPCLLFLLHACIVGLSL